MRGRKRMAFALASSQIPPHQNVGKTSRGEPGQRAPDVIPRATVPTRFGLGDGPRERIAQLSPTSPSPRECLDIFPCYVLADARQAGKSSLTARLARAASRSS